jgi:hypothetical protein
MVIDLELFNTHLLSALFSSGHKFFVRQTLPKAYNIIDAGLKASFLITHYNDTRQVNIHLKNIEGDPNKWVYDMDKEEDRQKIYNAALQPAGYRVYTNLKLKEMDQTISFKRGLKKYMENCLDWHPRKSDDVSASLSYGFGIFYITFKWNSLTAKVKADDVSAF